MHLPSHTQGYEKKSKLNIKHFKQIVVEDNSHSYYQRMVYLPSLHCSIRRILTHPFSFLDGQNLFD